MGRGRSQGGMRQRRAGCCSAGHGSVGRRWELLGTCWRDVSGPPPVSPCPPLVSTYRPPCCASCWRLQPILVSTVHRTTVHRPVSTVHRTPPSPPSAPCPQSSRVCSPDCGSLARATLAAPLLLPPPRLCLRCSQRSAALSRVRGCPTSRGPGTAVTASCQWSLPGTRSPSTGRPGTQHSLSGSTATPTSPPPPPCPPVRTSGERATWPGSAALGRPRAVGGDRTVRADGTATAAGRTAALTQTAAPSATCAWWTRARQARHMRGCLTLALRPPTRRGWC